MTDQGVKQIHAATMRVLAKKGMVFHLPEAVELAKKHGLRTDGETVYFTEKQLMDLIAMAPSRFVLRGSDPGKGVLVGDGQTHHIPGGGPQFFLEENGTLRDAEMRDYVRFTRMFHSAAEIPIMAGLVVQPGDINPDDTVGHVLYHLHTLSDKPFLTPAGDERVTRIVLESTAIANGGWEEMAKDARVLVVANPLSPLRMDHKATYFLMEFARKNQAVNVAPCAMAGSTAPMTLAGAFVQTNAETLAGIALAQMVRPGAKCVYGFLTTASDLKTGSIACGAPEQAVSAVWGGRLARFYRLPSRLGGGGITDSDFTGVQSGYESMMNLLAASQAGSDISFQAAGVLGSFNCMNMEKAACDLEVIGMVKRIERDIVISPETMAEDVIDKVAPHGQYLTEPHTVKHCRREIFVPRVSYRGPMTRRDQLHSERERILREVRRREEAYAAPDLPPSLAKDLLAYLRSEGVDPKIP
ncbi:MAG: trimethylamine methyltransferase family protein [Deltaproteobacteria bacterium]|jgi:trimethylamine--corrinoid protein Co-methyltransferase|nr:trimethylamine methyltransferase family protein [Deltaproteobacteria bacterium]